MKVKDLIKWLEQWDNNLELDDEDLINEARLDLTLTLSTRTCNNCIYRNSDNCDKGKNIVEFKFNCPFHYLDRTGEG